VIPGSISFIVATSGRPTLEATLASMELLPGDELIVVGENIPRTTPRARYLDCPAGNDWGHTERNIAMRIARGSYIAHLDDDDTYAPGARLVMAGAMRNHPARPLIFRMQYSNGLQLWRSKVVEVGNVGTPMTLLPNDPALRGEFGSWYGGDIHYVETFASKAGLSSEDFVWLEDVTVLIRPHVAA
jgi:hypothetical protein